MQFVKVELMYHDKKQGSYIDRIENIHPIDFMDGMEPGSDSYRLSIVEMSETEFEKLPEFMGF